jgi:hypothetical protein
MRLLSTPKMENAARSGMFFTRHPRLQSRVLSRLPVPVRPFSFIALPADPRNAVTQRPYETNLDQFALWHDKRVTLPVTARRVAIAHCDVAIAESLVLLLGLKGFAAQSATGLPQLSALIEKWRPGAIMIDTRLMLDSAASYVRALQESGAHKSTLLLAMSNFLPEDSPSSLVEAGFDGHCRRPCPMWRISDILSDFFACA